MCYALSARTKSRLYVIEAMENHAASHLCQHQLPDRWSRSGRESIAERMNMALRASVDTNKADGLSFADGTKYLTSADHCSVLLATSAR
jgi:hypothetical protein